MIQNILVICVGNICRSPIAEAILLSRLSNHTEITSISSAGLSAMIDYPADPIAQSLMQERGLDLSHHRARQFTAELGCGSDLILTMTSEQQQFIESEFPSMRGRVHRIGKWGEFDVPDPYKRPKVIFEQSTALIEQGINEWHKLLWN